MSTKENKLIQIFFNVMLEIYEDWKELCYMEDQMELQEIITSWLDEWRKVNDNDYDIIKEEFLARSKRIFNKAIRERMFEDMWLNYSPKEL